MMNGGRLPLAMPMGSGRPGPQPTGLPPPGQPPLAANDASYEPAFWKFRDRFRDVYLELTQQMYFKLRNQVKAIEAEQGGKPQSPDHVNQRLLKLFSFCLRIMTLKDEDLRKEVVTAGFGNTLYSVNSARKNLEAYIRAYKQQWDAVREREAEDAEATKARQEQLIRKKIEDAVLQREMQQLQNKVVAKHKAAAGLTSGSGPSKAQVQQGAEDWGMQAPQGAGPAPSSKKGGKRTATAAGIVSGLPGPSAMPPGPGLSVEPGFGLGSQDASADGGDGALNPVSLGFDGLDDMGYVRLPGFEDDMGMDPMFSHGGLDDGGASGSDLLFTGGGGGAGRSGSGGDTFFPAGETMRMEDLLNLGQDMAPAPSADASALAIGSADGLSSGAAEESADASSAKKVKVETTTAAPAPVSDPDTREGEAPQASGSLSVFDRLDQAVAEAESVGFSDDVVGLFSKVSGSQEDPTTIPAPSEQGAGGM